jgi:mannosyltransferase OCH1-like enzyme
LIPKVIHYCWLSGDPFPELVKRCIASWKEKLTDYEFILWDKDRVEREFQGRTNSTNKNEFHKGIKSNLWLEQTIQSRKYAFAADFLRVYALYHYGGIYLDADVEIIGTFDPFLENDLFIGFDIQNDLETAVVGSAPGHLWIKSLCDYYNNRPFLKKDGKLDIRPLPIIFDKIAKQLFYYKRNGKFQTITDQGISIYPCDYFSPKNIYFNRINKTKNTVAIHHFDGKWVEKNLRFQLKRIFHRALYKMGGKIFHNEVVQLFRKISSK